MRRSTGGGALPGEADAHPRVDALCIADSSIFPQIANGNLNAPSVMVGEKAADHILGRTPLPSANAGPWVNPRWPVSDR